jgi:hypothetical protein
MQFLMGERRNYKHSCVYKIASLMFVVFYCIFGAGLFI